MAAVPTTDVTQQAGFAPRRQYDLPVGTNAGPSSPVNISNGKEQPNAPAITTTPTTILQRPKVKRDKVLELTAITSRAAIEESFKVVSFNEK